MVGTRRLSVQHTENGYPMSTFPVTSNVALRPFPAARAARQWIPFNDVSDGVASSFTNGEAADLTRRRRSTTSLTALSLSFTTATPGPRVLAGHVAIKRSVCPAKSTDMPRAATHCFYSRAVTWSTLWLSL